MYSCGGDTVIIPDSVVPGLDGISWGKTCKGGRGGGGGGGGGGNGGRGVGGGGGGGGGTSRRFQEGSWFWIRGKYHFYSNHFGLLV